MIYNKIFYFVFLIACLTICGFIDIRGTNGATEEIKIQKLTNDCMTCLCGGGMMCDPTFQCEGEICGMYNITKSYWSESGKPVMEGDTLDNEHAFSNCATFPPCAKQIVFNYLAKYAKDCNNDGVISCIDYAAVHIFGPNDCNRQFDKTFKKGYDDCQNTIYSLYGSTTTSE